MPLDFGSIAAGTWSTLSNIAGMSMNALVAYCAVYRTPQSIRVYDLLIFNFAVTDFVGCAAGFFVQQRVTPSGWSLFYISNGPCQLFGPRTCYNAYSIMLHMYSHTLWSMLLSFSYRLYILKHSSPSRTVLGMIVAVIYIPSLAQAIIYCLAWEEYQPIRVLFHQLFPEYEMEGLTITGHFTIIKFTALAMILHMTIPITPVYGIIVFIRHRIICKLRMSQFMSVQTKNMHSQLLKALTFQALIPVVYWFGIVSYALGQTGIFHHPALEYLTIIEIGCVPILSPLVSLIYVRPYKEFVLSLFGRKMQKESVFAVTAATSSWNNIAA